MRRSNGLRREGARMKGVKIGVGRMERLKRMEEGRRSERKAGEKI